MTVVRGGREYVAVRCADGCGFRGYREIPNPPKPCPRCGAKVDAGFSSRPATATRTGSIGGRTVIIWGDWPW